MRQAVLFLHLLAAVYWIGEMLVDALIFGPAMRSLADRPWLNEVAERTRPRLVAGTWISVTVLVITGVGNMWLLRLPASQAAFWSTRFGTFLAVKLVAVALLIGLTAYHAGVEIPRVRRLRLAAAEVEGDRGAELRAAYLRARKRAALTGRTITVLGVVVLYLALRLVIG